MASGDSDLTYAEPEADPRKTALRNQNFRGLLGNIEERGDKKKSIQTPSIQAPELSMENNREIKSLQMLLHDSVKLFSHKEVERKKQNRSKKYLVITIILLSNMLSIISTASLIHFLMFRQCSDNNIPVFEERITHNPTIPTLDLGILREDPRTQSDQRVGDSTEGTPELLDQMTIYGQTDPPQQERPNTTVKFGTIWD